MLITLKQGEKLYRAPSEKLVKVSELFNEMLNVSKLSLGEETPIEIYFKSWSIKLFLLFVNEKRIPGRREKSGKSLNLLKELEVAAFFISDDYFTALAKEIAFSNCSIDNLRDDLKWTLAKKLPIHLVPRKYITDEMIRQNIALNKAGMMVYPFPFPINVFNGNGTFYCFEYHDEMNIIKGPRLFFHNNGVKGTEEFYKDGQVDGELIHWNRDGKIIDIWNYSNGVMSGKCETRYSDGSLFSTCFYKEGNRDGVMSVYHPNGSLCSRESYVNGERVGYEKSWFNDKKIRTSSNWARLPDGSLDLVRREEWYENGKRCWLYLKLEKDGVEVTVSFRSDGSKKMKKVIRKSGETICTRWYDNGIKSSVIIQLDGEEFYRDWYPNGSKRTVYRRKCSKLHGLHIKWYEDGELHQTSNYKDGKEDGWFHSWDKDGALRLKWLMSNDKPVNITNYYPDGEKECLRDYKTKFEVKWNEEGSILSLRRF